MIDISKLKYKYLDLKVNNKYLYINDIKFCSLSDINKDEINKINSICNYGIYKCLDKFISNNELDQNTIDSIDELIDELDFDLRSNKL